jgi:hypothetical protein
MRRCREVTAEDPKAKHYINILMSSVEYDTFVKLMRIMRPVALQRAQLKAEMKDDAKSEDSPSAKAAKDSRFEEDDAIPRSATKAERKYEEEDDDRQADKGSK